MGGVLRLLACLQTSVSLIQAKSAELDTLYLDLTIGTGDANKDVYCILGCLGSRQRHVMSQK